MNQALYLALCTGLVLTPLFLPRSERRCATLPVLLGTAGFLACLFTEMGDRGAGRFAGFIPSRELSEAVAD